MKEFGTPLGTAPDGAPYNQLINGDEYLYQQMWSNERAACEQRAALPPVVTKLSPKKGPAAGGTKVTVTGSGFLGSVTVDFGSSPGNGRQSDSAVQLSRWSRPKAPAKWASSSTPKRGRASRQKDGLQIHARQKTQKMSQRRRRAARIGPRP